MPQCDVSHELRTPLTSLRGQIEVLFMDSDLSEGVGQDLRQIQAELVHLSRIVSNLLSMARAEIGVLPPYDTYFSLLSTESE
jgi:two-component system OmpR family sensor kinase